MQNNWKSLKIDFPSSIEELCDRAQEAEVALQEVENDLIHLEKKRDPTKTFYIPPKVAFKFKTAIMRAIEVNRRMLKISRIIQTRESILPEIGERTHWEKTQEKYEKELKTTTERLVSFKVIITGYESFLGANMQVASVLSDTYNLLYAAKKKWIEQIALPEYKIRMGYRKNIDAELKYQIGSLTEAMVLFFDTYTVKQKKEREELVQIFYEIASKYEELLNKLPEDKKQILSRITGKKELKNLLVFELYKGKPEALLNNLTKGMQTETQTQNTDFISFSNQLATIQQNKILKIRGYLNTKKTCEVKPEELEALYLRPNTDDNLKLLDNILIEILGRAGLIIRREEEFKEVKVKEDATSTF